MLDFGIDISNILLIIKIVSFLVSLVLAAGIVISWLGVQDVRAENRKKEYEHFNIYDDAEVSQDSVNQQKWDAIVRLFQSSNQNDWRLAIIDADTLLEDMITGLGYQGESFGEKLKSIQPEYFPYLNEAWHVHKLRNKLAHEGASFNISQREAYQAYRIYDDLFRATGYLS